MHRAYVRACNQFFAWCEDRGLTLTTIWSFDVATATYIKKLGLTILVVKQHQAVAI